MGWSATMNVAFPGHTNLLVLSINVNIQYAPRREKTSYWGGGGVKWEISKHENAYNANTIYHGMHQLNMVCTVAAVMKVIFRNQIDLE